MILQNDFKRQWQEVGDATVEAVGRVGASGWYILGPEVERFEAALAQFCGVRHAVGVGNGMDALEIALRCLGLQAGDRVLTTPLSAFATTLAILRAGGIPVFVDVDDRGAIDLAQCRRVLERDRSMRFLLPVHLYGLPLAMDELRRLRDEFDLRLVEDCAQAIGASSGGTAVGTVGQAAALSFYPTKNLGAFGDAGALLTNDGEIAARAKQLRHYGQSKLYEHDSLGLNSRLDELHAAILVESILPRVRDWTDRRRQIARQYTTRISHPLLRLLETRSDEEPVWHLFPVLVEAGSRDKLRTNLEVGGVRTGIHYPRTIPDQPAVTAQIRSEIAFSPANARRFAQNELSLPIHPFLTDEEVEIVVEQCNAWKPQDR